MTGCSFAISSLFVSRHGQQMKKIMTRGLMYFITRKICSNLPNGGYHRFCRPAMKGGTGARFLLSWPADQDRGRKKPTRIVKKPTRIGPFLGGALASFGDERYEWKDE